VSARLARTADLEGLRALYRELRPGDPAISPAALERVLADPGLSLVVCESAGRLGATCMLAVVRNLAQGGRPFGVIEHVVTLSALRRQGLAREALAHALALAWAKGCYKVMLLSGAERAEAHRLYESVGFRADVERGFVAKPPL
jgi:GNAT superfamily N-acetyltransferase